MSTLRVDNISPLSGDQIILSGSLSVQPGSSFTGSLEGTASYALTASYAMNGGGGASTGDITFENIKIIGAGTGSGDGNNYSTIELVPDNDLYNNDQYLIIDPTAPNHVHIRAGGTIDSSSAYLYLGGEKSNVVVRNLDNSFNEKYWVEINSQTGSTQSTWIFDDNGNTLFPTLTTPRGDTSGGDLTTNTLKLGNGTAQAVISTPNGTDSSPSSQRLVINPGQGSGSSEGGDIYLWAGRGGVEGGSGGDIKVRGGYGPVTGNGGYVRIEGGDTADGNAGFVEVKGGNSNTTTGGDVDIYGGLGNSNTQNGNVTINTYDSIGSIKTWAFDTSGSITVPGDIVGAGNLATTGSNTFDGNQTITGSLEATNQVIAYDRVKTPIIDASDSNNIPFGSFGIGWESGSHYGQLNLTNDVSNLTYQNYDTSLQNALCVYADKTTSDKGIEAPYFSGSFTGSLEGTAVNAISSSYPISVIGSTIYSVSPYSTTPDPSIVFDSVFLGAGAGDNTTASYAIFIGNAAGNNALNAGDSNFLGSAAGSAATEAYQSNFIGNGAGYQATNANTSNFIGTSAGQIATNASQSNFLGYDAGFTATNAASSNFLGYGAGKFAISASNSTLIGFQVGSKFTLGPSIGPNNIIIGTNITLEDNRRDSINIGGIIFGTGSHSDMENPPSSEPSNGRIGINVTNPQYTLDVSGSVNITGSLSVDGLNVMPYYADVDLTSSDYNILYPGVYRLRTSNANDLNFPNPDDMLGQRITVWNQSGGAVNIVANNPKDQTNSGYTSIPDETAVEFVATNVAWLKLY